MNRLNICGMNTLTYLVTALQMRLQVEKFIENTTWAFHVALLNHG